jgi:acylglycerol lipase
MCRGCFYITWIICLLTGLPACMPITVKPGPDVVQPQIRDDVYIAADGSALKLNRWLADNPKAMIVAVHGFNDYRRFFSDAAEYLRQQGISSYAYDQRGFGESARPGFWAGEEAYASDLRQFVHVLKAQQPGVPVYLLGESMGGAIVIDTLRRPDKPPVDGAILSAPAVWGRETMPWYQTSLLAVLSHTLPWLTLSGSGMKIRPSDNIDMLRALGRDPLVIKETRVDAIYGLTNLMDAALAGADQLSDRTLVLYGRKDEIVPPQPTALFVESLQARQPQQTTVAYYDNGYHMLLRDLQAPLVWRDVAQWIAQGGLKSCAINRIAPDGSCAQTR